MPWGAVQVDARKAGKPLQAPSGASGSKDSHPFGWRDAMDIIVKWRQLSEPNDQVQRLGFRLWASGLRNAMGIIVQWRLLSELNNQKQMLAAMLCLCSDRRHLAAMALYISLPKVQRDDSSISGQGASQACLSC